VSPVWIPVFWVGGILLAFGFSWLSWRMAGIRPEDEKHPPTCPNCGEVIRAHIMRDPNPEYRLRDHFKVCVS
jgi:hypothetical protein